MKLLITAAMLFYFASDSRADDRSCKKQCRETYRTCLDKAYEVAEESYMGLDMLVTRISSESIRKLSQHAEDEHKAAKVQCRKDQKSCAENC